MISFTFGNRGECTYCGRESEHMDHVIPLSYVSSQCDRREAARGVLTPSCARCNGWLGNRMFACFLDRLSYIQDRLLCRRDRVSGPDWDEDELEDVDSALRGYIQSRQGEKQELDNRLLHNRLARTGPVVEELRFVPELNPLSKYYDHNAASYFACVLPKYLQRQIEGVEDRVWLAAPLSATLS
jgi:hypothetical protein